MSTATDPVAVEVLDDDALEAVCAANREAMRREWHALRQAHAEEYEAYEAEREAAQEDGE